MEIRETLIKLVNDYLESKGKEQRVDKNSDDTLMSELHLDSIEFNDVVELYNKLNIDITSDIIKRVSQMQDITETTRKQLEILKQTNGTEVFNEALEKTSMLTAEIKKALKLLY